MTKFQNNFGYGYKSAQVLAFFGNKNCSYADLTALFPEITFRRIQQTHSDIVVEASSLQPVADAHYTSEKNIGLVIATADCLPILIYKPDTGQVAAVHAGWKGVANQITQKALEKIYSNLQTEWFIFVGPHIQKESFEVDEDVLRQLTDSTDFFFKKDQKYYVDLKKIVKTQIRSRIKDPVIFETEIDTKKELNYNSFRRDQTKERNLSFISLL